MPLCSICECFRRTDLLTSTIPVDFQATFRRPRRSSADMSLLSELLPPGHASTPARAQLMRPDGWTRCLPVADAFCELTDHGLGDEYLSGDE